MDEYNDNANDEMRTLVKATSSVDRSLNGHARREATSLAQVPPARPVKEALSTTSGKLAAQIHLTSHAHQPFPFNEASPETFSA